MGLTPVEIRHVPIGRGVWGYRREAVERLLDEVAESYEEVVWRERADLADRAEGLEEDLSGTASSSRSCARRSSPPKLPPRSSAKARAATRSGS